MFSDLEITRESALALAHTLLVNTMVIAVGNQSAIITADDHDGSLTIINAYDPFD